MSDKFRFDISFLRVCAIIAVLFYHFNIPYFNGGFVGVDVFFVVSGFLMTKIIFKGFDNNTFSVLDFYKKRVARIVPALLFMILFFGIMIYFVIPTKIISYLDSAFSSSLFFSNIFYYFNSGYFDAAAHENFLLHTWSLSVEWQFYMLFPLICLFIKKTYLNNSNYGIIYLTLLVLLSIVIMAYHNTSKQSFSFYFTHTRAWEMIIGGVAYLLSKKNIISNKFFNTALVYFCYIVIMYFVIYADSNDWPSYKSIIPVLATSLILLVNVDLFFYKYKPFVFLGNISYSLYLFHWPICVIAFFLGINTTLYEKFALIGISIILATFSYFVIERKKYNSRVNVLIVSSLLLFLFFGVLKTVSPSYYFNNFTANLVFGANKYKYSDQAKEQFNLYTKHYSGDKPFEDIQKTYLEIPRSNKKNWVLLGDSHAGMFAKTMQELANEYNANLIQLTADGTFPMKNSTSELLECTKFFNYIFDEYLIKNCQNIDMVIINANYAAYKYEETTHKLLWLENYLDSLNLQRIYLGQTNIYTIDFPTYYYMHEKLGLQYESVENKLNETKSINQNLIALLKDKYLNFMNLNIDKVKKDGIPFIYDKNHLTYFGTSQYKGLISNKLRI